MRSCEKLHLDVKLCRLGLGVVQEFFEHSTRLTFSKPRLET